MMLSADTIEIQNKLGKFCQTGELPEIPGINKSHIRQYRRLVFNVIRNNLMQAYPIAVRVLGKKSFTDLAEDFFRRHKAQTPQIWKLPKEFYEFSVSEKWQVKYGLPWLNDLLLFEWMEIEVHTMLDRKSYPTDSLGELEKEKIVINPDFEIINLSYPVHLFPVTEAAEKKGNYHILLFRHPELGSVKFLDLSVIFVCLVHELNRFPATINQLSSYILEKFDLDEGKLFRGIRSFASDMKIQGLILGTLRK